MAIPYPISCIACRGAGKDSSGLAPPESAPVACGGPVLFPLAPGGKRLAGGIGLTPHLSQEEAGAIPLETSLPRLWDAARFFGDSEDHQRTLAFLSQDGSAFLVHLYRVVSAGRNLSPATNPNGTLTVISWLRIEPA